MTAFFAVRASGKTASAAALALALAGCAGGATTAARYDQVYPIAVETKPELIEVAADGGLAEYDRARVDAFGRSFLKRRGETLTVAYPKGREAGRAVADVLGRLGQAGVPADQIVRGPYDPEVDGARGVVVSFYAPSAIPATCPERKGDPNDASNATYLGFGCAYQHNIAVMLEEPRDAAAPRPPTPPSADRRHKVLVDYAAGSQTASEQAQERVTTTDN